MFINNFIKGINVGLLPVLSPIISTKRSSDLMTQVLDSSMRWQKMTTVQKALVIGKNGADSANHGGLPPSKNAIAQAVITVRSLIPKRSAPSVKVCHIVTRLANIRCGNQVTRQFATAYPNSSKRDEYANVFCHGPGFLVKVVTRCTTVVSLPVVTLGGGAQGCVQVLVGEAK